MRPPSSCLAACEGSFLEETVKAARPSSTGSAHCVCAPSKVIPVRAAVWSSLDVLEFGLAAGFLLGFVHFCRCLARKRAEQKAARRSLLHELINKHMAMGSVLRVA